MFDPKKAQIFQAIKWSKNLVFKFAAFLKWLFLFLFIILFFSQGDSSKVFAASLIFLSLFLAFWLSGRFFNSKMKNPDLPVSLNEAASNADRYNIAEFFSFDSAFAYSKSKGASSRLFLELLSGNPKLRFIFGRLLLNIDEIKKIIKKHQRQSPESDDMPLLVFESLNRAAINNHSKIEIGDILTALADFNPVFKDILIDFNLKSEDIDNLSQWLDSLEKNLNERKKFWEWKNLIRAGSLAKAWTSGYTLTLDRFSTDLTEAVKRQGWPEVVGHQKEIEETERILAKNGKNNALIVGEPGSGRESMIRALAIKSALGESFGQVNYKRVVRLNLTGLLAQADNIDELERYLDGIFKEISAAGNIILVIDEFHNFTDIFGTLAPYLASPQFPIVAITTFEGLHKYIEQSSHLSSLFEKVEVTEISRNETLLLLENLSLGLERKHKIFISYPALREIINYSAKYLPAFAFPEKALKLLDEAVVYISQEDEKVLLPKHVARIVSEKTQIPVGEIEGKEKEILLNLENLIHQRVINQAEAVKEVSSALRRARAHIRVRKGTIGSFLFMGPTGVGKTETAKALAFVYFGSEDRMIRLDMSEFQSKEDISRLIGSAGEEGILTTKVKERPFSLLLLDEIEKAHPDILNLFLQVLDEGHLTDGLGRKVDFKNTIIISTSNAGYQIILEALRPAQNAKRIEAGPPESNEVGLGGENSEWSAIKEKLLNHIFEQGIFRPEFINRFDGVVVFKPLSKENLLGIAALLLDKIKTSLKEKEIDFVVSEALKEKIVELGYDPMFGARHMQRVIQDKIGNVLAMAILSDTLKRGSRAEIDPQDFKLIIT